MRLSVYTLIFILFCSLLNASDVNSSNPLSPFDINSTLDKDNTNETNTTAKNWFFYRNFLTKRSFLYYQGFLNRIDAVQLQGTDAVIVVGSGVDYYLYNLLSHDNNTTKQSEPVKKVIKEEEQNFLLAGISSDTNESVEQYIASQKGETDLPQQIASRDERKGERTFLLSKWFDDKNINDDFLDRNNRSYIRLRGGYAYNYRGEDEYIYSITARLKIPRTEDKFELIIGDETKNSSDLSLEGTEAERDNSVALGINNVLGLLDSVNTKIRLGLSGVTNPYSKAAVTYEALVGRWLIVPHQTFKYSVDDEFEEWTKLDFRRRVGSQSIFSLLLQRSTITNIEGMDYFAQPSLNFTLGAYGNFTPYLGIYGRTKEQPVDTDGYAPKQGVYRYAAGLNWSKQASRKYIVYRLQPILSYDDQYAFRPNYYIKALLEFYFGLRD